MSILKRLAQMEPEIEPQFYEGVRDYVLDGLEIKEAAVLLYFYTFDKEPLEVINLTGLPEAEVMRLKTAGLRALLRRFPAYSPEREK